MEYKNIINIKIKDFQLVEDNNYKALNKQFVDTEHLYVFDYNNYIKSISIVSNL